MTDAREKSFRRKNHLFGLTVSEAWVCGLPAPSQWAGGKAEELGIRSAQQRPLACEGHKGEREGGVSQGHNNLPKACPPVTASYTSTTFQ